MALAVRTKENKIILPKERKEEGKKTLIEIIEDTKSGMPAQSEVDNKEKRAFLKK